MQKARLNGELVRAGLSMAWLEAFEYIRNCRVRPQPESHTSSLYDLIPSCTTAAPDSDQNPDAASSGSRPAPTSERPAVRPLADFYRQVNRTPTPYAYSPPKKGNFAFPFPSAIFVQYNNCLLKLTSFLVDSATFHIVRDI